MVWNKNGLNTSSDLIRGIKRVSMNEKVPNTNETKLIENRSSTRCEGQQLPRAAQILFK